MHRPVIKKIDDGIIPSANRRAPCTQQILPEAGFRLLTCRFHFIFASLLIQQLFFMKKILTTAIIASLFVINANAQTIKLDYFSKIPVKIKNCGVLYTYDTTALKKKKYIMIADFQNIGMIVVNGKQISLQLGESKLENKTTNVSTYTGGGYTVVLSVKIIKQTTKVDTEEGKLEITKGTTKLTLKIHGESSCDESKQEVN